MHGLVSPTELPGVVDQLVCVTDGQVQQGCQALSAKGDRHKYTGEYGPNLRGGLNSKPADAAALHYTEDGQIIIYRDGLLSAAACI